MPEPDTYGGRVKLRHLKIIIAVAQSGSMARAAESLAISHPVISKAIAELEQTLGVRLFDRGSQGVELLRGRPQLEFGNTCLFHGTSVLHITEISKGQQLMNDTHPPLPQKRNALFLPTTQAGGILARNSVRAFPHCKKRGS